MHVAATENGIYQPTVELLVLSKRRPVFIDRPNPGFWFRKTGEYELVSDVVDGSRNTRLMHEYSLRVLNYPEICGQCADQGVGVITAQVSESRITIPASAGYAAVRRFAQDSPLFATHLQTYYNESPYEQHMSKSSIEKIVDTTIRLAQTITKRYDGIAIDNWSTETAHAYRNQFKIARAKKEVMRQISEELEQKFVIERARYGDSDWPEQDTEQDGFELWIPVAN